ncbi:MAG: rhomboid family intramembrane serine protease [Halobacteriales archaeon]
MARCDRCGAEVTMPYRCRYCGGQYCSEHRLPENHDCPGLDSLQGGPGVFDSGFDASVTGTETDRGLLDRLGIDTGPGGPLAYVRNNVTYVVLLLMWLTFIAQWAVLLFSGNALHRTLFVLTPQHPEYVWAWVTSIFAHDPGFIAHIVFNSLVILFFGPLVERHVGSKRFAALFLASGVLAGLSQIGIQVVEGAPEVGGGVLGASGAALAIMGVLTVMNPNLRVYLYAILPMPIWVLTAGIAAISVLFVSAGASGALGTAHAAHLVGLVVGLAYGGWLRHRGHLRRPHQVRIGGTGGPPPRRRF